MIKAITLIATVLICVGVQAQECGLGLGNRRGHIAKPSISNPYPGGKWSSTKARYGKRKVSRGKNKPLSSGRQLDMPLERCAILAMTGIGVGFLGTRDQQWVGLPAVGVAVAMPFPGQSRNRQFKGGSQFKSKLLGLFGFVVSYGVGLGVGQNLVQTPNQL